MRAPVCLFASMIGCTPTATVEHTMPITNLQPYHTVELRVRSTAFAAQGQAVWLQNAVSQKVGRFCRFQQQAGAPADVVLDLNITRVGRGGGSGLVTNHNLATMETLLVVSDGQSGELLGTARIRGKSSGLVINSENPEQEAIEVVAKTVTNVLINSGCAKPRIARAEPPATPPNVSADPPGTGSAAPIDDTKRAEAEKLNEQGKEKLRGADMEGAHASFQQAIALVPDPRYQYNVCLAFEAQEQFANAVVACKKARGMNPEPRLVAKIDHRLELLQQRH